MTSPSTMFECLQTDRPSAADDSPAVPNSMFRCPSSSGSIRAEPGAEEPVSRKRWLGRSHKRNGFRQGPAERGSEVGPLGQELEICELKAWRDNTTHEAVRAL